MEYIFENVTKDEILESNSEQLQAIVDKIKKNYDILSDILVTVIEKKISKIAIDYNIETVSVEPFYYYRHNGDDFDSFYIIHIDGNKFPFGQKILPKYFKNNENIGFFDLQKKISDELSSLEPLSILLKKRIKFNIPELRTKFAHSKLENLIKKNDDIKSEILKSTSEQLKEKIKKINEIYLTLSILSKAAIEKKITETVIDYDIKAVYISPVYESIRKESSNYYVINIGIDEKYYKQNEMVPKYFKDAEDINFADFRKKIYNSLKLFSPINLFIKENMEFNVYELRAKNMYYKLEKDISIKSSQKAKSLYKM